MIAEPTRPIRADLWHDEELAMVHNLFQTAGAAGLRADRNAIVDVYVSLKSRPFLILTGEKQTGKIELVKCLAHELTEAPAQQCQLFVGHPRWAGQSQNVSRFVEMQAQLNRNRLLAMIEEAVQPENASRLYIACLSRISPAELYDYFAIAGFQYWQDQARIKDSPAIAPIPYPPNFRLVGTLDTAHFNWWEAELLAQTTVVNWQSEILQNRTDDSWKTAPSPPPNDFLQTCIHSEETAYARLQRILRGQRQAFLPLMQVHDLLYQHNVSLPHKVLGRMICYLANSWTEAGSGLFDPTPLPNLNQALDLALAHYVLPWIVAVQPEPNRLLTCLDDLLNEQFNQASAFINALNGKPPLPGIFQPNCV